MRQLAKTSTNKPAPSTVGLAARLLAAAAVALTPIVAVAFDRQGHRGETFLRRATHLFAAAALALTPIFSVAFDLQGHRGEPFLRRAAHLFAAAALALTPIFAVAFDLQGHRGARGLAPENTLPAFAAALSVGVSTLELDTAITKDGVVVVSHDARLNPDITRGPDGRYLNPPTRAVRELRLDDLAHFDVGRIKPGSEYSYRYPDQKRMDQVRMPTLAQVFQLARSAGNAGVRFNIEIKTSPERPADTLEPDAFAKALLETIAREDMSERVIIQSFDWRALKAVQQLAPTMPTAYLSVQQRFQDNIGAGKGTGPTWTAGLQLRDHGSIPKMVKAAGGAIWSPYFPELSAALAKEAQALGLKVIPWTVNKPEDMARLIDWGVDGMITDYPDRLREVMLQKKLPLPPATPVASY